MISLEKYEIRPQKPTIKKKRILINFVFQLRAPEIYTSYDIEEFKQAIAFAKYKRIDIAKQKAVAHVNRTMYLADELELDALSYCAYTFFCDEQKVSELLKYVLANCDTKKHQKTINNLLVYLLKDKIYKFQNSNIPTKYYTRTGLKNCSPLFVEIFELLIQYGADITKVTQPLSEFEFATSDYANFLTLLVKYNNPEVNDFLCKQIYSTSEPQFLYDFLEKNNIKNYDANYAIQQVKQNPKNIDVVKMLLQKGALDIRDFSPENVKNQMKNMYFYNSYEENEFLNIFANLSQQQTTTKPSVQEPEKVEKYKTKKQLSEAEIAINNIFENAKDNVIE